MESREVPAVRGGERANALVRFHAADVCTVEVAFRDVSLRGVGHDLFSALVAVRRDLDTLGWLLACNGSRRDVYPSQMGRQASRGRLAYLLTLPRTTRRPEVLDIFDVADERTVSSVDDQRAWFDAWAVSPLEAES
jgi:hypothetical protein